MRDERRELEKNRVGAFFVHKPVWPISVDGEGFTCFAEYQYNVDGEEKVEFELCRTEQEAWAWVAEKAKRLSGDAS